MRKSVAICTVVFLTTCLATKTIGITLKSNLKSDEYQRVIMTSNQQMGINYDSKSQKINTRLPSKPAFERLQYSGTKVTPEDRDDILNPVWKIGTFGSCIGLSNLEIATHVSPYPEIICGGSHAIFGNNSYWYIVKYDPDTGNYYQDWLAPARDNTEIIKIIHEDIYEFGYDQIVLVMISGKVEIYDRATRALEFQFSTSISNVSDAVVADFDKDNSPDLFVIDDTSVVIYNLVSGALVSTIPYGGFTLTTGQMDGDSGLELAISNGDESVVYDLDTETQEWLYYGNFGVKLETADLDGDSMDELVGICSWDYITAFDVDLKTPKWQVNNFDNDAIYIGRYQTGGDLCVFVGDGQWGDIRCLDGIDGGEKWTLDNPEHGVTDINIADTDNDGTLEILWGSGYTSSGEDHLYIVNPLTEEFEWQNIHLDPPFRAFDVGHLDDDSNPEIAVCSFESDSGYENGYLMVFDAVTHSLELMQDAVPSATVWVGMQDLTIGDLNPLSTKMEYLIGTAEIYDGQIWGYNYPSQSLLWSSPQYEGVYFTVVEINDVDKDGQLEVIGSVEVEHTGADGVYIYVFDATSGNLEWKSVSLVGGFGLASALAVADIDNDGQIEIGVTISGGRTTIYSGEDHILEWQSPCNDSIAMTFADIDPVQPGMEILIGSDSGTLLVYDGIGHTSMWSESIDSEQIDGLKCANLNNDPEPEILATIDGYLKIYDSTANEIWSSSWLGSQAGYYGNIVCDDFNKDEYTEVYVGSSYAFYEFSTGQIPPTGTPTPVIYTATPSITPTSSPSEFTPTPTGPPPANGVTIEMPAHYFSSGDRCYLDVDVYNGTDEILSGYSLFVLLDIQGEYWFAPGWAQSFDYYSDNFGCGLTEKSILPHFDWPANAGSFPNAVFWSALLLPSHTDVFGEYHYWEFGWGN